jgi:hypothetical protein
MPWTAKQLKLFRAAAHNPAISKSSGIKQADAERMSKESLKKMAGGGRAVINKQDTKHGKMDMPFNKLNRFAGMKAGGMMKKGRRFDTGGDVDAGLSSYAEPQKVEKEVTGEDKKQGPLETLKIPRRTAKPTTRRNTARAETGNERRSRLDVSRFRPSLTNQRLSMEEMGIGSGMKKGGSIKRFAAGGMTKGVEKKLPTSKQMGALGMKSGGMKESKAMVGKEVAFMKKKGAPKSMIKHEAAEMGAMKYARGGGIESKGKTKGTIIKMAAGGLAGGHKAADGIAQRGKTKGMKVSMKGGGYC